MHSAPLVLWMTLSAAGAGPVTAAPAVTQSAVPGATEPGVVGPGAPPVAAVPVDTSPVQAPPAEAMAAGATAAGALPVAAPRPGAPTLPVVPAAEVAGTAEKVVAVLDLKVEGDVEGLANALSAMIATGVEARPGLRAVSRSELRSILANAADAQLLGCESVNCLSSVARLADASLVVSGSIGRVDASSDGAAGAAGPALVLTLSLLDPSVPAVVARTDAAWRGAPEELITVVPALLDKLFDGAAAASYVGALEVFAPEGATVFLDGAQARTGLNSGIPIGVHTVEVARPGYVSQRVDVVTLRNTTGVLRVELEPEPFYSQWWFWTGVGVGTAAAVAGGTAIAFYVLGSEELPPTVLKVDAPLPAALKR